MSCLLVSAEDHLSKGRHLIGDNGSLWLREAAFRVSGNINTFKGALNDGLSDYLNAIEIAKQLNIRHRLDESKFKAASLLAALERFKEAYELLISDSSDKVNINNSDDFSSLIQDLLYKLLIVRGYSSSEVNANRANSIKDVPLLKGIHEELQGDIKRLEWQFRAAKNHYLNAYELYEHAQARNRLRCLSLKLNQMNFSPKMPLQESTPDPGLSTHELFWLVF